MADDAHNWNHQYTPGVACFCRGASGAPKTEAKQTHAISYLSLPWLASHKVRRSVYFKGGFRRSPQNDQSVCVWSRTRSRGMSFFRRK